MNGKSPIHGEPTQYYTQYAYDEYGRLSTITDPNSGVTEYTYIGTTSLTNTIENAEGEITDYDYDKYNRVQYVKIDPSGLNLITEYEYDGYTGRQTAVIDPEENRTEYTYDIQGRRTKVENEDGTTIEYTYSAPGSVKTVTSAIGTVTYTYDELDRQLTVEDPEGNDTTYTYDTYEFVTNTRKNTVTDADSKTTDYTYDLRGRLVKLTDPEDKDTVYEYDDNGNMTKLTYTVNSVDYDTTFTYDYMDRPLVTTYPDTTTLIYVYDIYDDTYDTGTDKLYNKRTDRASKVTVYYPDKLGRITEARYLSGTSTVEKIVYVYDAVSRIETATVKDDEDTTLSQVGWTYDNAGRATQETQTLGGDTKAITYQFNDIGAPTQIDYPGDTTLTLEYDVMNRLDKVKKSSCTIADYMYNAVGQPVRVDLLNGTRATYEYNKAGQLMKLENLIASSGKIISSYAYNRSAAGYPDRITREDGFMIEYDYDDNHQVTEEKMLNPEDDPNIAGQQPTMVYQHNYEYDEIGNRMSKWYDNDAVNKKVTYSYDNGTSTTHQKLQSLSGTRGLKMTVTGTVSDLIETGGKQGDIDKVEVTPAHTVESKVTGTMVKSSLRLPFWVARGVSFWDDIDNEVEAKAYDKAGNTTTDTTQSNITLESDAGMTMTYDGNACMSSDGVYNYEYDYENRLVRVKQSTTLKYEYQYDALGRRIKKTIKGSPDIVTRFIYDGQNIIQDYSYANETYTLKAEYIHGIGIDNVLRMDHNDGETTESYYYYKDGMGSTSEITDDDGALVQAYEYDAWGNATIYDPSSEIPNSFLYTGREWDSEINLYYYRARHYAPQVGRFLQPDLIDYKGGINVYVYVRNMATIAVDPFGYQICIPVTIDPFFHDPASFPQGKSPHNKKGQAYSYKLDPDQYKKFPTEQACLDELNSNHKLLSSRHNTGELIETTCSMIRWLSVPRPYCCEECQLACNAKYEAPYIKALALFLETGKKTCKECNCMPNIPPLPAWPVPITGASSDDAGYWYFNIFEWPFYELHWVRAKADGSNCPF